MSLTTGRGPLSGDPAGWFDGVSAAALTAAGLTGPGLTYVEPLPRRVRGIRGGAVVVDSERVLLVHRPGRPPTYAFPAADVSDPALAEPEPGVPGYVQVAWGAAETWYEEEQPVIGHPVNPYHRVDARRSGRRLRVEAAGQVLVDTADTVALYETGHAPRLYVRPDLVRQDLLQRSETETVCPYKGVASYWSVVVGDVVVADAAWSYQDPIPECRGITGLLSFDDSRVTLAHDLPAPVGRPVR